MYKYMYITFKPFLFHKINDCGSKRVGIDGTNLTIPCPRHYAINSHTLGYCWVTGGLTYKMVAHLCYNACLRFLSEVHVSGWLRVSGVYAPSLNALCDSANTRFWTIAGLAFLKTVYKNMETKGVFFLEIIINILVNFFWFIWIPMLWVYGHYK